MRQPAHDDLVRPQHLLPVDAEILAVLVRPARHHQPPGDQRRDVARPAVLDRQFGEIDILAFPDDLLTRCRRHLFRRHVEHLLQHRQLFPGILQPLGRLGFFKEGEQLAHFAQRLHRFLAHAQRHALRRAKQVGEHRDLLLASLRRRALEKQRRPAGAQHAVADLGHFKMGIDRRRDAFQFAGSFQLRHEVAQIMVFHRIRYL